MMSGFQDYTLPKAQGNQKKQIKVRYPEFEPMSPVVMEGISYENVRGGTNPIVNVK